MEQRVAPEVEAAYSGITVVGGFKRMTDLVEAHLAVQGMAHDLALEAEMSAVTECPATARTEPVYRLRVAA